MILVGNQRGGGRDLAHHLLKEENDHVQIHEIRGFASETLEGAFCEAYAVSRGTRCRQYLFSLSLNPPQNERVSTQAFEQAIEQAETRLGLTGQPRAVVFHEKEGRRHAHAVWSRINAENMKAIQLSHSHNKLMKVSRELYREHGWRMPEGMTDRSKRDPRRLSLEEWQQAKRLDKDPRVIKGAFQDAWAISDNATTFSHALEERGFKLARGDRRGFVAIDEHGKPYSVATWTGVKTKAVREKLGDERTLPSLPEAKERYAREMQTTMDGHRRALLDEARARKEAAQRAKAELVARQRDERQSALDAMEARRKAEVLDRQARFRPGLSGVWDHLRGEHARIRRENELAAYAAHERDRKQRDDIVFRHIEERQRLTRDRNRERLDQLRQRQDVRTDARTFGERAEQARAERLAAFKEKRQTQAPTRPRSRDGPDLSR
ncbi:relaxase/mobilization nuclease domain-containing protein [Hyphobacterium sp.]|uniref:relaxase/mobilization nuclease domain-containing protein n=1 Tax=Hyphobacterium sp. TaxID=2004662 RepID=UPI003748CF17